MTLRALGAAAAIVCVVAVAVVGANQWRSARQAQSVARAMTGGNPRHAVVLVRRYGCGGCHTIAGMHGADGQVGPPLVGMRERVYLGGKVRNTPDDLIRMIVSPQSVVPGSAMPVTGISEAEARDIAAFLYAH